MLAQNLLVLAALTATAAPLPNQDAPGLRWKFEKGRTFYEQMTTRTDQTMTLMGTEVKQVHKQTFVFSFTPEKQDGDRWVLRQKVEAVKVDIDVGGSKIAYDSTDPKAEKGALGDFMQALVGTEFRVTLDRNYTVEKVEGREELLKKLTAANPLSEALIRSLLSEEALKELANPMLISVPRREVDKGDYWVRETRTDMGPVGAWVARWQYVHMGKEKGLIKLKAEALKVEYQAPQDGGGALPFTVKGADFKSKSMSGTVLFDPEKGQLRGAEMSAEIEGALTIDVGGQESKVQLKQTQNTTYQVSDHNPLAKK
jgi:hypothetical protein